MTIIMKHINKIFLFIVAALLFASPAIAQTTQEEDQIRRRAAEKVKQMNDYISDMASKDNSVKVREYYKTKALNLFIGKGNSYYENGVKKNGVMMETTSVNTRRTSKTLMRNYFDHLINLRYSDVKITSTEVADIKVSRLKKIDDNLFECTCEYVQNFVGTRDGKVVYADKTTKTIKCYVEKEYTEDGYEYIILLGDVKATDTQRL